MPPRYPAPLPPPPQLLISDLPVSKGKTTSGPNTRLCLESSKTVKSKSFLPSWAAPGAFYRAERKDLCELRSSVKPGLSKFSSQLREMMPAPSEQKTSLPFVTLLQGWDECWGGAACFKSVQVEQTVWMSFSLYFLITGGRKQLGSGGETKRYLHK